MSRRPTHSRRRTNDSPGADDPRFAIRLKLVSGIDPDTGERLAGVWSTSTPPAVMAWFAGFDPDTRWLSDDGPNLRDVSRPFALLKGYGADGATATDSLLRLVRAHDVRVLTKRIDSRGALRRLDFALRTFIVVATQVASRRDVEWAGMTLSDTDGFNRISRALRSVLETRNAPALARLSEWLDPGEPDRTQAARLLERLASDAQEASDIHAVRRAFESKGSVAVERNGEAAITTLASLWNHIVQRCPSPKDDRPFNRACVSLLRKFPGTPGRQSGVGLETLIRRVLHRHRDLAEAGRRLARR